METESNTFDKVMWLILLIGVLIFAVGISGSLTAAYWQRRCIDAGVGRWTVTESGHKEFQLGKEH